jgi:hypothetical protein
MKGRSYEHSNCCYESKSMKGGDQMKDTKEGGNMDGD